MLFHQTNHLFHRHRGSVVVLQHDTPVGFVCHYQYANLPVIHPFREQAQDGRKMLIAVRNHVVGDCSPPRRRLKIEANSHRNNTR